MIGSIVCIWHIASHASAGLWMGVLPPHLLSYPPAMPSLMPAELSSALAAARAAAERRFAGIADEAMPPGFAAIGQAERMITSTAIAIRVSPGRGCYAAPSLA